jgi:hypothetical protein
MEESGTLSGQNLSLDKSVVGFKERIPFISYNLKKQTKCGLGVYVLPDSGSSYVYTFLPYF